LKKSGFLPDVIFSHYGYGLWRAKSIFQKAKLITYCEWMFNSENEKYHSWGLDKDEQFDDQEIINLLTRDSLETAVFKSNIAICPSHWQKKSFPQKCKNILRVVEDGFPLTLFHPEETFVTPDEDSKLKVLYISRGLEYTRGLDRLYELVKNIEKKSISDSVSFTILADKRRVYDEVKAWKLHSSHVINKLKEFKNVKFIDQLPYNEYVNLIRKSDLHLYLSRPFVLSWSFIESSLLGSYILSLNNQSTIEASHSNHIDCPNLEKMAEMLKLWTSMPELKKLRMNKLAWTRTDEYKMYSERFSLAKQVKNYLMLLSE